MSHDDRLIDRTNTSAATMAAKRHARTGIRTSPYRTHPERETYLEIEIYERADGTRYKRTREISRWGASYDAGAWSQPIEMPEAR